MNPSLKRSLWCRWFHRYRRPRGFKPVSVRSEDPSGSGAALVLIDGGFGRTCCDACADTDYGTRAYKRWCVS